MIIIDHFSILTQIALGGSPDRRVQVLPESILLIPPPSRIPSSRICQSPSPQQQAAAPVSLSTPLPPSLGSFCGLKWISTTTSNLSSTGSSYCVDRSSMPTQPSIPPGTPLPSKAVTQSSHVALDLVMLSRFSKTFLKTSRPHEDIMPSYRKQVYLVPSLDIKYPHTMKSLGYLGEPIYIDSR